MSHALTDVHAGERVVIEAVLCEFVRNHCASVAIHPSVEMRCEYCTHRSVRRRREDGRRTHARAFNRQSAEADAWSRNLRRVVPTMGKSCICARGPLATVHRKR